MPDFSETIYVSVGKAACRHGRTLFTEIPKLGYVGCYSGLAKFLSPWRPKAETRTTGLLVKDAM